MKNPRTIFGIVLIVLGAILLFFSNYIAQQVAEGKLQIAKGQQMVDTTNSVFATTKTTKPIGEFFTSSGQKKINEGRTEVAKYEDLAHKLQIAGVVLILAGVGVLIFWRKR